MFVKPVALQRSLIPVQYVMAVSLFTALVSKIDLTFFIEKLCECGEGFLKHRQYDLAFTEIYDRFSDRMKSLREQVLHPGPQPDLHLWHYQHHICFQLD